MPIVGFTTPAPFNYSPLVLGNQFPLILSTGAIARYPLARQRMYSTKQIDFADFSRQTASLLSNPLMTWDVTLSELTDQETAALSQFFDLQKGSAGTFTFIDPWDNLLKYSEMFENSAWTLGAGMLVGSNYVLNSQRFDQASWTPQTGVTVTPNTVAAPDGTTTADTIAYNGTGSSGGLRMVATAQGAGNTPTSGMPVTFSIWLKVASGTQNLSIGNNFSSSNITVTTAWQRFQISGSGNGSGFLQALISSVSADNSSFSVFAWGAQLEFGNAASDYTPTTTATAILQIADPFFLPAPTTVPGYQWNLNSAYPRRGRQIVVISNTNPFISQSIGMAPAGMPQTLSIYFKQQGTCVPSGMLFLAFDTNEYENVLNNVIVSSSWARLVATGRFSQSNPGASTLVQVGAGGTQSFGLGAFYMFGAQLETEGVVSAYKQTQAVSGVHSKCYINTDEYAHIASEFDVNAFENSLRQRRSTLSQLSDVLTVSESA